MRQIQRTRKPREIRNHTIDSSRWDDFVLRDGDIIAATWAKAGTTWIQQILSQLIFSGASDVPILDISPWIEQRCFSKQQMLQTLDAQNHRRFVKTHLPASALALSPSAKHIYVARDGRDALWSWYDHHQRLTTQALDFINSVPGRVGPPLEPAGSDVRRYFHEWLDRDGYPIWPFWSHVQSWWDIRNRPNVLLLHYNNLRTDLAREIEAIAEFIGVEVSRGLWPRILEHCSFAYMKENASKLSQHLDLMFQGGATTFVHKGTNGRWRDVLSQSDLEKYEKFARRNLTRDCAEWLATGRLD